MKAEKESLKIKLKYRLSYGSSSKTVKLESENVSKTEN
jgi:hypothetical protein